MWTKRCREQRFRAYRGRSAQIAIHITSHPTAEPAAPFRVRQRVLMDTHKLLLLVLLVSYWIR